MASRILMEEYHQTVFAARGRLAHEYDALRQTPDDRHFQKGMGRAIRRFVRR